MLNALFFPYPPKTFRLSVGAPLPVPFVQGIVEGGPPRPGDDYFQLRIDLAELLLTSKTNTHYFQLTGRSMVGKDLNGDDFAIPHGSLLQVDRSLTPRHGDIVLGYLYGSGWTVKFYQKSGRGNVTLMPANPDFEPVFLNEEVRFDCWGVVVWVVNPLHAITRNRVRNIGGE